MAKRWLYLVVRQKEESPVVNFSLTHEAIPMLEQHQDSLLPRVTQGEEGHETAEKRPDLVFIQCAVKPRPSGRGYKARFST